MGIRLCDVLTYREKNSKRETKIVSILTFIAYPVWKLLFGKNADGLEKSNEADDECTQGHSN